jgi:trk system potassium uptake protein TrkH
VLRFPALTDKQTLFLYFIVLIVLGTGLLMLPSSFDNGPLGLLDALFTAVSAVCVTGLSTVATGDFSTSGQIIILFLIQAGGLGFITFSTLYLVFPGSRFSFSNMAIIQEYYGSEHIQKPERIVRRILGFTFSFELAGMVMLYIGMRRQGVDRPLYSSVFHGISAFCNAGFSLYDDSLTRFSGNPVVLAGISFLIITGGLGFLVHWNIQQYVSSRGKKRLLYHSRIMLVFTPLLIALGFLVFFLMERHRLLASMGTGEAVGAALFQSITTRTAGFNTIDQGGLSQPSFVMTLFLMLTGGGSGSTAGGLKVSTMFLLSLILIKGIDDKGEIPFMKRRISQDLLNRASLYFMKASVILMISVFMICLFESVRWNSSIPFRDIVYECCSALGTVGLSTGITSDLSSWSQSALICTMFAGRIGLFAIIIPAVHSESVYNIRYPEGEVLIG